MQSVHYLWTAAPWWDNKNVGYLISAWCHRVQRCISFYFQVPVCVKELSLSSWNPPPGYRKLAGEKFFCLLIHGDGSSFGNSVFVTILLQQGLLSELFRQPSNRSDTPVKLFQTCWHLGTSSANRNCWQLVHRLATTCEMEKPKNILHNLWKFFGCSFEGAGILREHVGILNFFVVVDHCKYLPRPKLLRGCGPLKIPPQVQIQAKICRTLFQGIYCILML